MNLESMVKGYITKAIAKKIGDKLGLSPNITQMLVDKAVPLFLGGMANNASQSNSAASGLFGAITKDHDGNIFDNLDGLLGDPKAFKGDKILKHVLGAKEVRIQAALATDTGIDKTQVSNLMQMMGPLVMGALGKEQSQKNLEASHLAKMFASEKAQQVKQKASNPLLAMLDKEGNGVVDDLLKMGMAFLKRR